ncbi:MAG: DUF308 domain-containing protein [Eubacteriales bacterium]|nr:DUF308 domain-containing protein [Eubacteriales bacterium]MDD3882511.1 DUF308 domain-containing protein [Eubacteriales bacterium]MDD4512811.1 DUF308 domain-containing protein [Eubacteriales bacterium]
MLKYLKNCMLGYSALFCLLGIVLMIWPIGAFTVICYIMGAVCMLYGAYRIVLFFAEKSVYDALPYSFLLGMANVLLGLFLVVKTPSAISIFSAIVGIAILVSALMYMQISVEALRAGLPNSIMMIIGSALMLLLGILTLFHPFAASEAMGIFAGASMLVDGITGLVIAWRSKKLAKLIKNELATPVDEI